MRVLTYGISADKSGGIETFLFNMNKFMSDDMAFDYIVEGTETVHQKSIEADGGRILFISPKRKIFSNIRDWNELLNKNRDKYHIVYFNMYSLAWIIPVFLCLIKKYKVIVHAHNSGLFDCGIIQRLFHAMGRQILKLVPITRFTNSELSSEFFFGNKKSEIIYNAIDPDRFSFNMGVRNELRQKLGLNNKNVYGFSGRIANSKNPLFLMDIFSHIYAHDNDAAFLVCGEGSLIEETKEKAKCSGINVYFTGNVSNIEEYYQVMDCFVFPSKSEGLGIVLIEAQCAGLPCVTSADVVPKLVEITELVEYVSLNDDPGKWAAVCSDMIKTHRCNRYKYSLEVKKSGFNLHYESAKFEERLRNI